MRLAGSRTLELRVEIFNALNRKNYQLPDSFVDRPTFGQSLVGVPRARCNWRPGLRLTGPVACSR